MPQQCGFCEKPVTGKIHGGPGASRRLDPRGEMMESSRAQDRTGPAHRTSDTAMNAQLAKEYTSFFFSLNGVTTDVMHTPSENQAHRTAYELAARSVHLLPSYCDQPGQVPSRYTLNPDDTMVEERNGVLAWSIQVEANKPLDPATVQELRGFFEDCYLRAAQGNNMYVRYVDGERFKVFADNQMEVEDFV